MRKPLTSVLQHFLSRPTARVGHRLLLAAAACLTATGANSTPTVTTATSPATVPLRIEGLVLDASNQNPIAQVAVRLYRSADDALAAYVFTDSAGHFLLETQGVGPWRLRFEAIGYESVDLDLTQVTEMPLAVTLPVRPLLMDELTVRARRADAEMSSPAFVEVIPVDQGRAGMDLAVILDQAVGVKTRRYGGLGSFSTVSIRGSTAEQVQVYLDGVPLNQAMGGGVDLGTLPTGGIESVEVYRGAVPARFGGNAIGGVVHVRTKQASGERMFRVRAAGGSFANRELSASAGGTFRGSRYLGMVDYGSSGNEFRFLDDNGTAFNALDDEWVDRRNNDFRSLRTLGKLDRKVGGGLRLQGQHIFDIANRGIPGVGSFQAADVRFDTWRSTTELEAFGLLGPAGYRLVLHHLLQEEEYKDLKGEVGLGVQHERNQTASAGVRLEANLLLGRALSTLFAAFSAEEFTPENVLRPDARLLDAGRRSATAGSEFELPMWRDRLHLTVGGQGQWIDDDMFAQESLSPTGQKPGRDAAKTIWGGRLGASLKLWEGWNLKGHGGRYGRPPSFFELFGDRGAVIGNTDLVSEEGVNLDLGLVHRPVAEEPGIVRLFEVVVFQNRVSNLIRFVHNSQLVTRPHNLGKARIRGLEARGRIQTGSRASVSGNYAYQVPVNRSPLSYERGRDLPNAPRHGTDVRVELKAADISLHYEFSLESRHYLDRTNLRPVPRRIIHGVGGRSRLGGRLGGQTEVTWEVRNLTANQVADLWGYPLPGRSYFVAVHQDVAGASSP